jgi:hypothetical protein
MDGREDERAAGTEGMDEKEERRGRGEERRGNSQAYRVHAGAHASGGRGRLPGA